MEERWLSARTRPCQQGGGGAVTARDEAGEEGEDERRVSVERGQRPPVTGSDGSSAERGKGGHALGGGLGSDGSSAEFGSDGSSAEFGTQFLAVLVQKFK